jgi:hypothetical protein
MKIYDLPGAKSEELWDGERQGREEFADQPAWHSHGFILDAYVEQAGFFNRSHGGLQIRGDEKK